ncbi:MAG: S46 family peptidase [Acidobacteria bacterium]|nr:S46 family peptidase [Acidobacteriota bacterium]
MQRRQSVVAAVVVALAPVAYFAVLRGDEGMWTFDNVPRQQIQQKYGVTLTDAWLGRLQQSVVRLESGCTGSFVSSDGLILTNHHCAQTCLAENSTSARDLVAAGFQSAARSGELRCEGEQASILVDTRDVTSEVTSMLSGAAPADLARIRNQTLTRLEEQCEAAATQAGRPLKCEAVTLYQGGQYWLYEYKRYDDVRLAFAPEAEVAAFGGDPDNFQFPRWCLDFSLLRAYEQGKPATPPAHLTIDWAGPKAHDPVFVAGHPGTTQRLLTAEQLKTQRDVFLPFWLLRYSELRGRLIQHSRSSAEAAREAKDLLDTIENSHKVRRMQLTTLLRDPVIDRRAADDRALRDAVAGRTDLAGQVSAAWDDIVRADAVYREILMPYTWIESGAGFDSDLFSYARQLVRAAAERTKPNAERLREYTDARLPALRQSLGAATPVHPAVEQVRLSFALERMREYLGADHPVVARTLGALSPDRRARDLIARSTLANANARLALFDGGEQAIAASKDPMIALARAIDADARALRTRYESEVTAPTQRAQQALADARFAAYGASRYPDATFTLRLSYGAVDGWMENGRRVEPVTTLGRMYERATGSEPFVLPKRWLAARSSLDPTTPVNLSTTNDIVGGNSGSPIVNAAGEIVGLIFDGNIHSIAGSYWYDPAKNRSVAVHPAYIRAALRDVYRASAISAELGVSGPSPAR